MARVQGSRSTATVVHCFERNASLTNAGVISRTGNTSPQPARRAYLSSWLGCQSVQVAWQISEAFRTPSNRNMIHFSVVQPAFGMLQKTTFSRVNAIAPPVPLIDLMGPLL